MILKNIRTGRLELAVCLVGPWLVLAALVIPAEIHGRLVRNEVTVRRIRLAQAPALERQLAEAQAALKPFLVGVNGEKTAALTLLVGEAAAAAGFTVQSVNVEKQATGSAASTDVNTTINGSGNLSALVLMLDTLTAPGQPFRVAQITLGVRRLTPETTYDVDLTLASRAVSPIPEVATGLASGLTPARIDALLARVKPLTVRVNTWASRKRISLNTKYLSRRIPMIALPAPAKPAEAVTEPLRLRGIIQEKQKPLALTDSGVFGVGDEVDGGKIVDIQKDRLTLLRPGGRREIVRLYADEEKP